MLAAKVVEYGYDLRKLIRDLCASRTYQLAAHPSAPPAATFASAPIRRLTAEQLYDAIGQVTGVPNKYAGVERGGLATQLPGPSGGRFLSVFGRPDRTSSCTCDRRNEPSLSQVLHLINGNTTTNKLRNKAGRLAKALAAKTDDATLLEQLWLAAYGRPPTEDEQCELLATIAGEPNHQEVWEDVFWAVLNSKEFLFNH